MKRLSRWSVALMAAFMCAALVAPARAQCFQASITAPTPFLGNHDEIFRLDDGSFWQVKFEYQYLYEYYPTVTVCPSAGKLIVGGKALSIVRLSAGPSVAPTRPPSNEIKVVAARGGCRDYFVADGPGGYFLLEWYGGYEPSVGDTLIGDLRSYGFKDVFYPKQGQQGRVYVDDYLLSRSSVIEKYVEKCR